VVCEFAIVLVLLDVLRCNRQGAHLVLAYRLETRCWPLRRREAVTLKLLARYCWWVSAAALVRRWRTAAAGRAWASDEQ